MLRTKTIVHVSDAKVSNDLQDVIVTHSLGSCIAICLYDPVTQIGGMLHYQLPDSKVNHERARQKPFMYADTGMKILLEKLASMGAYTKRMQVKIDGGATMDAGPNGFDIGKRNYLAIRKILWKNGMMIDSETVGGTSPRNVYMNIDNGTVTVESSGLKETL